MAELSESTWLALVQTRCSNSWGCFKMTSFHSCRTLLGQAGSSNSSSSSRLFSHSRALDGRSAQARWHQVCYLSAWWPVSWLRQCVVEALWLPEPCGCQSILMLAHRKS